jgi:Abnormal spindle-like microcephaly-assoc'd, ASPM-SPD-2-Hydin
MPPLPPLVRCRFIGVVAILFVLLGVANNAVAAGRICTTIDTFQFGNRQVGSSTTATSTVSNCGDAPWSLTDASVHPATGPWFQVSATCMTGLTLAPGEACTVSVRFAPFTPGQTSGGFWLHNTTSNPDELITFYGRGVDADSGTATLEFLPATADFAAQLVGTLSAPLDVKLHNLGPAPLTLTASVLNGPAAHDFFGYGTCQLGAAIAAGDSCDMQLVFQPQSPGTRLANLVIDSPQLSSLAILQISGLATSAPASPQTVDVVEFYSAALDHYFMTSLPHEIDVLDSGATPGWIRTGRGFKAYPAATAGASPVCRFYLPVPQNSHFYSASAAECAVVATTYPSFTLESSNLFYIPVPDATGACAPGTTPVSRLYNNRADANHRYTTDPQISAQMISQGYIAEGAGPNAAVMCAPQ